MDNAVLRAWLHSAKESRARISYLRRMPALVCVRQSRRYASGRVSLEIYLYADDEWTGGTEMRDRDNISVRRHLHATVFG